MKRLLCLWLLLAIYVSSVQAEVVVLRSGQQVKGEILLNNDDVVILRRKDGSRYQYPKAEVISIQTEVAELVTMDSTVVIPSKKVSLRLTAAGGAAYIPHCGWGGTMDAQLMMGTHKLLDKPIFLGGSIGFRSTFKDENTYSWIPLQLVFQSPLSYHSNTQHHPLFGASFGYSFATNKQWGGGICAGVDLGWWYRFNDKSSLSIALTAQWQQAQIDVIASINGLDYTNHMECNIVGIGLKVGVQF